MKKFKEIAAWTGILLYLFITLGFISKEQKSAQCTQVLVEICDKTENNFVDEQDVLNMIQDKGDVLVGQNLDSINLNKLEKLIYMHPSVRNVEIYTLANGKMKIDVSQRVPIIRIINQNSESYYIDQAGALMPLSDKYTAHVLVANGFINEPYELRYTKDVVQFAENDTTGQGKVLSDLYKLSEFFLEDDFWKSQIEQIFVNKNGEYELVPRVGSHLIILGSIDQYKKKIRNLKALYMDGLRKHGWNQYRLINLKYEGQIICSKI